MRNLISFVLLAVLPLCLSSFLPVSPFLQGNKRRTAQKVVSTYMSDHGDCEKHISGWQEWDGGAQFTVRYKNSLGRVLNGWKVELELTKPPESLRTYNGNIREESKTKFVVTPPSYGREVAPGANIQFQLHMTFTRGSTAPQVKRMNFNGEEVQCKKDSENETGGSKQPEYPPHGGTTPPKEDQEKQEQHEQAGGGGGVASPPAPPATTGEGLGPRGVHVPWPKKVLGLYVLLADDDEEGYESESDSWTPELFEWQQQGANVLFFTFIHPETMDIPPAFKKLAATRGTGQPGAVPKDTVIIFAIGGYAYSLKPNPWHWLTSKEKAEAMAEKVAKWPELYNCDGIDLDLEEGAGARPEAGPNMVHFIRRLRQLQPKMIISQPTYGYPQVQAEIDVINASWDDKGNYLNLADSIGLMVYEGTQSLNYVKNFVNGLGQWQGFPVRVNAPADSIILGAKGSASSSAITALARASVENDYRGIMVWYSSVKNGFHYAISWDAAIVEDSIEGYKNAMQIFKPHI